MKVADLDAATVAALKQVRWDRIIEKHEGPDDWESVLEWQEPEFLEVEGRFVLLPIDQAHHANLTVLRTIWSEDGASVTLFLKDTTYDDHWLSSGFLAVCDRLPGQSFYVAVVYHEWFIIEPIQAIQKQ